MQLLYSFRTLYTCISMLSPAQIRLLPPHSLPRPPFSQWAVLELTVPGCPVGVETRIEMTAEWLRHPVVSLALSSVEDRGKGSARRKEGGEGGQMAAQNVPSSWQGGAGGKEKEAYENLIFKWAPTSPANTQLSLAGQGHVIKRYQILQWGKKFKYRCTSP